MEKTSKPSHKAKSQKHPQTILLVEDESRVRALVGQYLKSEGYTVFEAGDARAAMQIFRTQHKSIDLMLADVILPGMGGKELASRLLTYDANTKVLFMSGSSDRTILRLSPADFRYRFIQKPFRLEELARKVRQVLTGK